MDNLGGRVNLFGIRTTSLEVVFNGTYGNPAIQFDSSINATPNVLVNLSLANAKPVDERFFKNQVLRTSYTTTTPSTSTQELILTENLSDAVCASLGEPGNPIDPVFALFNGSYWIHDPRFVSREGPRRHFTVAPHLHSCVSMFGISFFSLISSS